MGNTTTGISQETVWEDILDGTYVCKVTRVKRSGVLTVTHRSSLLLSRSVDIDSNDYESYVSDWKRMCVAAVDGVGTFNEN